MKFLFAIVLATTMAAGDGFDGHGNNPGGPWLQGVSIAGVDLAIPCSVVFALEVVMGGEMNPANECAELAMLICGEGRICCIKLRGSNGDYVCEFSCQDGHGGCQPCWGDPPNDNT